MVRAYTELDSAACGIQLTKTKIYLLLGYIRKRKLSLDSCQWYQLWKETTDPQKRGLKKFYGRNCECRIDKYCLKSPPETCDDMIGGCNVTDSDWRITQCKKQYAFCVKNPDGDECHWVEKKSFKKCLPKKDWEIILKSFNTTCPFVTVLFLFLSVNSLIVSKRINKGSFYSKQVTGIAVKHKLKVNIIVSICAWFIVSYFSLWWGLIAPTFYFHLFLLSLSITVNSLTKETGKFGRLKWNWSKFHQVRDLLSATSACINH